MTYKLKEVAAQYGAPVSTTWRHIQSLQEKGKFVRTSIGKAFNEVDYAELQRLLGFKHKPKNQ